MRRSLRYRLTLSIVGVLAVVLIGLSLVLDAVFAHALWRQLDDRLLGEAAAVAGMAEDASPSPEFEYESLPEFERAGRPAYFQAWLDDGRILARSPSLGAGALERPAGRVEAPRFLDLRLPDGRPGRAIQLRQPLRLETPSVGERPGRSERFVTVAVARGTEELVVALTSVRRWLFLLALLALGGASGAALVAVSRGLGPLRALGGEIARLDAAKLDRVLRTDLLPDELVPVITKVNELFARLQESFAREKRFTADVSHELRTPLAGLLTTLEVAASRDRTGPEYREAIVRAVAVVGQMQALCENLLALARFDAGPVPVRRQEVALRDLVQECWRSFEAAARARGLTFHNELGAEARVASDPDQLRVVISNLLSNAATYTETGGTIHVRAGATEDGRAALLEVYDSGPRIPEDVLLRVFDRFYRADTARGSGAHCGIGLALVKGVSETLGLAVTARNTADGGVTFALSSSGEASPPSSG